MSDPRFNAGSHAAAADCGAVALRRALPTAKAPDCGATPLSRPDTATLVAPDTKATPLHHSTGE